ncbi:MAG: oligonucleotide/oligosaccharide-binding fold domain-containing protein [Spirochaetaceae bacterium]
MIRTELPVYRRRERILKALETNQVIVVESPTGSGKTTQLPLILHEAGFSRGGVIGVTQPRRIAAVSVSEYIASELGEDHGETVGYKMRFEDHTSPETRIKIMTDGILLQELKADDMLSRYSVIMVDEAHERSLNIDFILGLLKRILAARPDFRVIVSSATINAEVFSEYFDAAPIVRIEAQMYPVDVRYDPPLRENDPEELLRKIEEIVVRIVEEGPEGDILIFLSGEQIIKNCISTLDSSAVAGQLHLLPLYGRLSKEEQDAVFPPPPAGKKKVVVATNIAETSITIDGITAVIDPGLAKMNYYNPRTFTSSLVEGPISKASANQRKGRAGRTRPGVCYRLYTPEDFDTRPLFTLEEIYRTDLSEVVLRMAELGIRDFAAFDFISSPGRRSIIGAVETLDLLDALDPDNSLSEVGRMMAEFPLLPRFSRMIVAAIRSFPDVMLETVTAAAFLSTNTPFLLPQGEEVAARRAHHRYRDDAGDFVSYLKLLNAYESAQNKRTFCERRYLDPRTMAEIYNVREQLAEIVTEMGIPVGSGGSHADYLCAVSRGLIQFLCARSGKSIYRSLTADRIQIHPGSVMFREDPEYFVAGEIVRTSRMYARSVSPIDKQWIPRIAPELAEDIIALSVTAGPKGGKSRKKAARDTTWQIHVGSQTFKLEQRKGKKKIAVLPWGRLEKVVRSEHSELPDHYAGMRGKILYQGQEILAGSRLAEIFAAAHHINPGRDIITRLPRNKNYTLPEEYAPLCEDLAVVIKLVRLKKSSRNLGFVELSTDSAGNYWFRPQRSFYTAVYDSVAALEVLADDLPEEIDDEHAARVSSVYRRLTAIIEESEPEEEEP